jgi:hypothetical protein
MEAVLVVCVVVGCGCVVGVVAIVFGRGFKSPGPGGFKIET